MAEMMGPIFELASDALMHGRSFEPWSREIREIQLGWKYPELLRIQGWNLAQLWLLQLSHEPFVASPNPKLGRIDANRILEYEDWSFNFAMEVRNGW